MWAFTHDVTVGKELMSLFIVVLFALLLNEFAVIIKLTEEV
jgi:hypothetical protein